MGIHEARYWSQEADDKVRCSLCPHRCLVSEGKRGICRVRVNRNGILYALNYGKIGALALDPVEKKPLYHFYPGRTILSAGTFGCNFSCGFCQNYELVAGNVPTSELEPEKLVDLAEEVKDRGNVGLAYTYAEPFVWYEYVLDTCKLAKARGLKNVLVTNGFVEEAPLEELLPYVDAMNIDLKSFREEFYRRICKGRLGPVMRTIEITSKATHVEVTTLLIPGMNDSAEEIDELAGWLAGVDKNTVLHLSRYHPAREFTLPPTPVATMYRARDVAKKHLNYVYLGNLGNADNSTYCPACGNVLVDRAGYFTEVTGVKEGRCLQCGEEIKIAGA